MLLECLDVFLCHVPSRAARAGVGRLLAAQWGLVESNLEVLLSRKPHLVLSPTTLVVGRATLPVAPGPHAAGASFAHTQHALCMLERVAACVAQRECVLLVGETGNGKTSVVQVCRRAVSARARAERCMRMWCCMCLPVFVAVLHCAKQFIMRGTHFGASRGSIQMSHHHICFCLRRRSRPCATRSSSCKT